MKDLIKLARECGADYIPYDYHDGSKVHAVEFFPDELQAFAQAIRNEVLEEAERLCEVMHYEAVYDGLDYAAAICAMKEK